MSTHRRPLDGAPLGPDAARPGRRDHGHRHPRSGARRAVAAGRSVRAGLRSQRDRRGPGDAARRGAGDARRSRRGPGRCRDVDGTAQRAVPPWHYGTTEDPLQARVGYYTEIAGLGASPDDVAITGKLEVYNRCLADGGTSNCLALVNFWRTISNLSLVVNAAGQDGCRASANFWAVSQAVSMRRLDISGGNLSLMDYCTAGPQFASGGFIADSRLPFVINGSQQQWLTRNSVVAGWSNAVWNQVFSGVEGAPDDASFPNPPYTTLDQTVRQPREAVPVRRRRRPLRRPRARGADRHTGDHVGRRRDARAAPSRSPTSTSPVRATRWARSTPSSLGASTCCSRPASTTWPAASTSSVPAPSCSAWATPR